MHPRLRGPLLVLMALVALLLVGACDWFGKSPVTPQCGVACAGKTMVVVGTCPAPKGRCVPSDGGYVFEPAE